MASVFTRIIEGQLPGRFVWKDDRCVVMLTIAPHAPGHVMVIPREEIDHWLDLSPELLAHLTRVSHQVGQALQDAFKPVKVGMMIAGLEVPHVHVHLIPIRALGDFSFSNADHDAKAEALDEAAAQIREALRARGHAEVSD
ncbi:MAG: HIT family protein [Proteobacteria bacterium]|nr:HIT family protein [Pseudomonadota bacterium]